MPEKKKAVKKARANYKSAVKKSKPGQGKRFDALSESIQAEGKSKKVADAVAAKAGRKKYGNKKMSGFSKMGKKRANK